MDLPKLGNTISSWQECSVFMKEPLNSALAFSHLADAYLGHNPAAENDHNMQRRDGDRNDTSVCSLNYLCHLV